MTIRQEFEKLERHIKHAKTKKTLQFLSKKNNQLLRDYSKTEFDSSIKEEAKKYYKKNLLLISSKRVK